MTDPTTPAAPALVTLCIPYYRNPGMLRRQAQEWASYPAGMRVVVVDDGSPVDPAHEVLPADCQAEVYRVLVDIPWARNGARNLAADRTITPWLLHTDIDHILTTEDAEALLGRVLDPARWYRFRRFRVGAADETRKKDQLPDDCTYGEIKPHVDSFLCTRELFWRAGGYDEDFSGSLGGSSLFLAHMERTGECEVLGDVKLHVHTRHSVPDSSDIHLPRGRERYARIRAEKKAAGDPKPTSWLRFPWERVR